MRRALSSKALALGLVALLAGATLLAWSMTWFSVRLVPGSSLDGGLTVGGDAAAPALAPLALAGLALVAALAIAGPAVRVVLSVVLGAIGVGIAVTSGVAMARPAEAVASSVTSATGLDGDRAVAAAVDSIGATVWPAIAIAVGVLFVVIAVLLAVTTRQWPGASRRYEGRADRAGEQGASTVSDWDSLSAGDDPTGPPPSR